MFKAFAESTFCIKPPPHVSERPPLVITRHGVPLWGHYGQNPDHAAHFAKAMTGWAKGANLPVPKLADGHVSVALARVCVHSKETLTKFRPSVEPQHKEFPRLDCIVRDNSSHILAEGAKPADLGPAEGCVRFMKHDFFEHQPVRDTSAALTRQLTHNWTDDEVMKSFKGVVPTLQSSKTGPPLLINEIVLPGAGGDAAVQQRTWSEFAALLEKS
ncbi:hypothetical protein DL771_005508 [Monosporascus sp. 5C6A]|nr:hypothetical protein DL771_005508 [Monosporascus sp. 5C6A]